MENLEVVDTTTVVGETETPVAKVDTKESTVNELLTRDYVTIDGEVFKINKLNARKTAFITNTLGQLLIKGKIKLRELSNQVDPQDIPWLLLTVLDESMLVNLAAVLIGSDVKFAEEHFDLSWVIEALIIQMRVSDLESIIRNFTLLSFQIQ